MCEDLIDRNSTSFEQRLIDDSDFCRRCWDEIMRSNDTAAITIVSIGSKGEENANYC
jgi:hypothetical protein